MVFRFVQPYDDPDRSQKLTSSSVSRGQAINAESDVEIRLQQYCLSYVTLKCTERHTQRDRQIDSFAKHSRRQCYYSYGF